MARRGTVLVTGGSGYIAGYTVAQLLGEGWAVRTTLRTLAREAEVRATIGRIAGSVEGLEMVQATLDADAGWSAAAAGCDFAIHVASPLPSGGPTDDDTLVRPARDGTLRVLAAARAAGVRRVVVTSSTAAIAYGRGGRAEPWDERDWSSLDDRSDSSAYERSKTIAERAAWDWHAREGAPLELTTVCPGAVLGPVTGPDFSASIDIVKKLMDGSLPGLPKFGWALVDVRDIAALHVLAMTAPAASGQRYIGAGPFYWMSDIAAVLRTRLPALARRVPKRRLPNWLVRLSATLDPVVRGRLFELDKIRAVSSEKARRDLGWSPRPVEDTIADTAESLLTLGLVRPA